MSVRIITVHITISLQVIDAASVDFWSKDEDELKLEMEIFAYPPSFKFLILNQQATVSSFMKVQFKLGREEFFMTLPLECGLVSSHKSMGCCVLPCSGKIWRGINFCGFWQIWLRMTNLVTAHVCLYM